jgi:hypothetical protein
MGTKRYFKASELRAGGEGARGVLKISRREKALWILVASAVACPEFSVAAAKCGMGWN